MDARSTPNNTKLIAANNASFSAVAIGAVGLGAAGLGGALGEAGEIATLSTVGETAETALAVDPASTGLSTLRYTQEGETFLRYESGNPGFSRVTPSGGLQPGTYAAPVGDGLQSVGSVNEMYNLPTPEIVRTTAFEVKPPPGTAVIGPRSVAGWAGSEVIFPFGVPPGSVGEAFLIPAGL